MRIFIWQETTLWDDSQIVLGNPPLCAKIPLRSIAFSDFFLLVAVVPTAANFLSLNTVLDLCEG